MSTSDPSSWNIFDCHHHVGDVKEFFGTNYDESGLSTKAAEADEVVRRIEIMDEGGVAQACVIPGHGYERTNGIADTRAINNRIAAYRDAHLDRFPVAVGIVEPLFAESSLAEIDRVKIELGLAGISFHTRFQGASMDSAWIRTYVAKLVDIGLVPVIHAMTESADEALWKVAQLAKNFPGTPMLVLDSFSTFEGTKQANEVAEQCPHLLWDTSLSYNFDFLEVFANRFGADRVVFGTDLYSPPLGRRISHLVPQILESSLSDDDKRLILGGNARRLFGVAG
jgi:predicted TIM-barrel fold metal-dependent hydrolase